MEKFRANKWLEKKLLPQKNNGNLSGEAMELPLLRDYNSTWLELIFNFWLGPNEK